MPELLAKPERPQDPDLVADIAAALGWSANLADGIVRVQMPTNLDRAQHAERATELNRRAHAVGVILWVFDRFWRGDDSRGMPGSGLGVAIVADAAASHGGTAHFDQAPLGGAQVVISLPGETPQPPVREVRR